jgi:hypothetical protein
MILHKFFVLLPSIRPAEAAKCFKFWKHRAVRQDDVNIRLIFDTAEQVAVFKGLLEYEPVDCSFNENKRKKGVVEPLFILSSQLKEENLSDDSIIIAASDDFIPPVNWDMYLNEKITRRNAVFQVNDGEMKGIISLPVMTKEALELFNYAIYNPAYNHMYSDQELFYNAMEMGILERAMESDIVFEHKHYTNGGREKDASDIELEPDYFEGKKIYSERMNLNIGERLKA